MSEPSFTQGDEVTRVSVSSDQGLRLLKHFVFPDTKSVLSSPEPEHQSSVIDVLPGFSEEQKTKQSPLWTGFTLELGSQSDK